MYIIYISTDTDVMLHIIASLDPSNAYDGLSTISTAYSSDGSDSSLPLSLPPSLPAKMVDFLSVADPTITLVDMAAHLEISIQGIYSILI